VDSDWWLYGANSTGTVSLGMGGCDVAVPTDVYPTRFVVGRVPNGHAGHEACERTDREISGEAKNRNLSAICLFLFFLCMRSVGAEPHHLREDQQRGRRGDLDVGPGEL